MRLLRTVVEVPSPVGHALGGLLVGLAGGTSQGERGSVSQPRLGRLRAPDLVLCAAAAVLPDVDFLWGRHNMETHSVGAAFLAGVAVLVWTRGRGRRLAVLVALAWASHVLFDWLGSDDTAPLGVMALWPLTGEFFFAHAYVFEAISRRSWLPNFWSHNLQAVAWEVVMLGPVAAVLGWWRRRSGGGRELREG